MADMILQISESNLKKLEAKHSRTLVGELLHQIEVVESQHLSNVDSFSLLKQLIKNRIYDSFRTHSSAIKQFSEGVNFTVDFIKPKA